VVTRTWTATDACENQTVHTQIITVQDTIAPAFVEELPADVTVECNAVPTAATLTATDNCGDATVTFAEAIQQGDCPNAYVVTRTWTATDACENQTVHTQIITVQDTIAPAFVEELPADVTVECNAVPTAATLTATDNCGDATVTFAEAIQQGDCPNAYVVTRTWTATDACENQTVHTQIITVQDTIAPAFVEELPADITVECNAVPTAATLTATDNCGDATVVLTVETQNVICEGSYTLLRTWVATDDCGNTTSHSQTITVQDTIAPSFVEELPTDITVECGEIPDAATLTAVDSCGSAEVTLTVSEEQGECAGESIITRTWVATDSCGNNISHNQIIIVQDTTGPVSSEFEESISVNCDAIPEVPELTFTDTCSTVGEPIFTEETVNETPTSYTIVRTWEVEDSCGNPSTFIQTIIVSIENSLTRIDAESCIGDITTINLDELLPIGTTGGVWVDESTSGALNENIFNPSEVPSIGNYILQYVITEGDCPRVYEVTMNVNDDCLVFPCDAIEINNAFTPNGDALNQYFSIKNIENTECYISNTVEIYNRWGVLVYEVENYNNNDRRFEGISEGRATLNKNAELPTGTYFYIINYTTPEGNVVNKSGYLYLTR
ncbi:gliding motility-associated C-terminal domain-containing protein, partial [Flavobacterium lacus]